MSIQLHEVSIYKRKEDSGTPFNRDIRDFLNRIKTGIPNKDKVIAIRSAPTKEDADKLKVQLPAATIAGTFITRTKDKIAEPSGLLCLDFDYLDEDTILELKTKFYNDDYVFSFFVSPSGKGLKVIIRIPKDVQDYYLYYKAVMEYFNHPSIDTRVHDISRLCFESFDPELYINEDAIEWTVKHEPELVDTGSINPVFELKSEHKIIDNTIKWWERKYGYVAGQRNSNLYILAAALNRYGVSKSDAKSVCGNYQATDFNITEINKIVDSAYKNLSDHNISKYEDDDAKQRLMQHIMSGKSEQQIKKDMSDFTPTEVESAILSMKESLSSYEYWTTSKSGAISLSHHRYKHFLEQNNFMKFYPPGSDNYVFIKVKENIIDDINSSLIKDTVLDDLMNRGNGCIKAYDYMASQTRFFKDDYLSLLKSADINLKEDTQDECYLYYSNCCLKVTKNGINKIDYLDMDGYVWRRQIVNRTFNSLNDDEVSSCVFKRFVWLISGQDEDRFISLMSVIGYLLHGHKTSANNRAIIFNDEAITDTPNGGSGKGIFCNAISKVKKTVFIDGKMFDFNSTFAYQTVSADTQVLIFDDVKRNFTFENLFSIITEGITLEKKNKDAIKIPINKSPKVVITTNYTIGGVGGSFERRKFEVELSAHFSAKHTPLDEFGHLLFDDWSQHEWQRFDNFMVSCVQTYLQRGLVPCEYKNLTTRKFIKETSSEFYEWVNDNNIIHNHQYPKADLYNTFLNEYSDPAIKKYLSQKRFTQWVVAYAKFKGLDYKDSRNQLGRTIEIIDTNQVTPIQDDNPF